MIIKVFYKKLNFYINSLLGNIDDIFVVSINFMCRSVYDKCKTSD